MLGFSAAALKGVYYVAISVSRKSVMISGFLIAFAYRRLHIKMS